MEHIDLKDFDIMGIFTLKDVAGIEKYVTEVSGNEYLSRSREYYQQKNFTELSNDRDMLNSLLTIGCRLSAKPDYKLLGKTKEWEEEWQSKVESLWRSWAETTPSTLIRISSAKAKNPVHAGIWLNVDGGGVLYCVREIGVVFQDIASLNLCGWFFHSYYRVKENT